MELSLYMQKTSVFLVIPVQCVDKDVVDIGIITGISFDFDANCHRFRYAMNLKATLRCIPPSNNSHCKRHFCEIVAFKLIVLYLLQCTHLRSQYVLLQTINLCLFIQSFGLVQRSFKSEWLTRLLMLILLFFRFGSGQSKSLTVNINKISFFKY